MELGITTLSSPNSLQWMAPLFKTVAFRKQLKALYVEEPPPEICSIYPEGVWRCLAHELDLG
jgi:hypothetical protein